MPHLLDIQTRAFEALLQTDAAAHDREDIGLERVFKDLFPITDVHENFSLEFVRYSLGEPKYSVEECIERDMTYSAPLKATLQLVINEDVNGVKRPRNIIEKEVYLGELPLLTTLGTFVINGAERVIVSQLHRSPGVVFEESTHPNGQRLISARIIPFRGSWVEFTVDIHDVIYVHIDKKKKFPATALLRAFGYGANSRHPPPLLRRARAGPDARSARAAPTARSARRDHRRRHRRLPGEAADRDAPKAKTKKAARRARARRGRAARQGRRRADRRSVQPPPPPGHRQDQGLRVVHDDRSARRAGRHRARRAPGAPRARRATSSIRTTGEVIAEAGQSLTDTLIKRLRKAEITKVQVFVPSGRAESTLIKNTLAQGSDRQHHEKDAQDVGDDAEEGEGCADADLLAAASGRRAQHGDGQAGARAAVLLAQALRPRPRRPLQDQSAPRPQRRRRARRCSRRKTSSRSSATSWSCTKAAATWTTSTTSATAASARSAS